ncbi:MAG: ASKHA domain-containing protein [Treponemataceae bacterium]|nr:ASKHA domain-containing protein [Treponemataceae bacterium]
MRCGFAVDIGTTNIEIALWNLDAEEMLCKRTFRNCLYVRGADVLSRILYAHYRSVEELQEKLALQLRDSFKSMIESAGLESSVPAVETAVLTGNTVMLHFICGLPVTGFEKAPFRPASLFREEGPAWPLPSLNAGEIIIPPCIGAFLGGDIVCAGLWAEKLSLSEKTCENSKPETLFSGKLSSLGAPYLVIDIGTNTEIMLVKSDGSRAACSAAAGPAFEGGGLSVGMKGAALVSALAALLDEGIMDETGYIEKSEASCLSQQDIRQLQLAKGATAAAVEALLESEAIAAKDIKKSFICGNFGNALDIEAVKKTGLLPAAVADKAFYAGNAALAGAELLLLSKTAALGESRRIASSTSILQLADSAFFAEKYIERMNFIPF